MAGKKKEKNKVGKENEIAKQKSDRDRERERKQGKTEGGLWECVSESVVDLSQIVCRPAC